MELDSLYQEVILEHYKRPLNKALKPNPTIQVQHINTSCGDEITLNLHTDGKRVIEVSWDGIGCSISQASTSVVSDLVMGKEIGEVLKIIESFQGMVLSKGTDSGNEELIGDGVAFAGVSKFPARVKCALLGWMATKDAEQAQAIRQQRNQKLTESDWTQVADAPVDKQVWATYRQALRDVTTQTGFPWTITWPDAP